MSTDFSIKPVGAPVTTPIIVRPQPEAVKAAVPTELPAPKAVAPENPPAAARNDAPSNRDQSYQVSIDHAAAEIVYRLVDSRTRVVLQQYPDEARLRSRAYQRALDAAKSTHVPAKISQTA